MKKLMQFIYSLSYGKKLHSSIFLLIVCDIFNIFWIKDQALNEQGIKQIALSAFIMKGYNPSEIPPHWIRELSQIAAQMITLGFVVFMTVNSLFYFLMFKKKKTGIKYAKGYAVTGGALTLLTTLQYIHGPVFWTIGQTLVMLAYFYCFVAIKDTFKNELQ